MSAALARLPEADAEMPPEFHHHDATVLPLADPVPVRVLIGAAYGIRLPVHTFAKTLRLVAEPEAGQRLPLRKASADAQSTPSANP
ncbi:MAG TPA: hypothetical protein VE197_07830 [Mycobacterium sp.]|nr:hypothetical protein [Mycobacterium sp.]